MGSGRSKPDNGHGSHKHAKSRTLKTGAKTNKESGPSISTLPSSQKHQQQQQQQQQRQQLKQEIGDKVGNIIVKEYYTLK